MWTILPLSGIGPLRFGMAEAEVAAMPEMGPPKTTQVNYDGTVQEFRELGHPMCDYLEGRLVTVAVDHHVPGLTFEGKDVFASGSRAFLLALQAANGGAEAGLGFVIFRRIGISTKGFYNDVAAQFFNPDFPEGPRIVEVFIPGKYDDIAAEFSPIDL